MPSYDKLHLLSTAQAFTTAAYSEDDVNFGYAAPGCNKGGGDTFGLNIVVNTTFAGLDSGVEIWAVHAATATPTGKHTGSFFAAADLVAGKHYFIPLGSKELLQYARAYFLPVSEAASAGKLDMWFGPGPHGA